MSKAISVFADATDQLTALASGGTSSRTLLEASLERYAATHDQLNCVVQTDIDAARMAADMADADRKAGRTLGALHGLPMTVKDSLDVAGLPAHSGATWLKDQPKDCADAHVVAQAKAAGAIIWGKTNVSLLTSDWQAFNDLYGTTNNPWDLTRSPGGSSGGAAAALAAGITPLEIGSDLAGSLRGPSHFCGTHTLKPTWGQISLRGTVPPGPDAVRESDLNVVGPMARSARDVRLLYSILSGRNPPAERRPLRGARMAVWLDDPNLLLDDDVRTPLEAIIAKAQAAGALIDLKARPAFDLAALHDIFPTLLLPIALTDMPAEMRAGLSAMAASLPPEAAEDPFGMGRALSRMIVSHADWVDADEIRSRAKLALAEFFNSYDAILCPVAATAAIHHDHSPDPYARRVQINGKSAPYFSGIPHVALASACHLPASVCPAGLTAAGLPVGFQIITKAASDHTAIDYAEAIGALAGGFQRPPLFAGDNS